jgi:hypothetical protein
VLHSIYPINHEPPGFKEDLADILSSLPFYETYDAGIELVESISKLLDEKRLKKEKITFYDIEGPYRLDGKHWPGTDVRENLISEYSRRARCGKTARRDLCGGCQVTGSPTAINCS